MCRFYFYPYNSVVPSLYAKEVVIKGLKLIILIKSTVIIYIVNLQYVLIIRVVDVNYRYCN